MKIQIVADKRSEQIICVDVFNGKVHDATIFKKTLHINPTIQALLDNQLEIMFEEILCKGA